MEMKKISIVLGDITKMEVDAIVNAANETLLGGGGVDGAIHRAAGPQLIAECGKLGGCKTGEAKITNGFNLPAKVVIHTAGPVWKGGNEREDEFLASCYRNSLEIAVKNGVKTIAFPSISTGAYGFPAKRAARIAMLEASKFLEEDGSIEKVIFACFDEGTFQAYEEAYNEIFQP